MLDKTERTLVNSCCVARREALQGEIQQCATDAEQIARAQELKPRGEREDDMERNAPDKGRRRVGAEISDRGAQAVSERQRAGRKGAAALRTIWSTRSCMRRIRA